MASPVPEPVPEPAPGSVPAASAGAESIRSAADLRRRMSEVAADRVLTLPNVISIVRLAGVPLFLWFALVTHHDANAIWVLIVAGISDWLDGKAARWLNQYSRLGELLDPVADRLYILATLAVFLIRGIVPWWLVALLVGRDLVLAVFVPILRRRGYGPLAVLYVGKAATFNLLYAFPLLLGARGDVTLWAGWEQVVPALAYAFTGWGVALYLWSGVVYVVQFVMAMRRPGPRPAGAAARLTG